MFPSGGSLGSIRQQKFFFSFFLIPKTPMWRKIPIGSVWLPAARVTHHLTSCKPTVRAARGAAALPSQFPVLLLQMHLEILLLLYIVAGLLKKNELSSTFLPSMHLRLAMGLASQKRPGIKPLLSCLTDFLNIHSSQINFLENGRGYIIL